VRGESVAQKTVYFDDLDETEGAHPITFALDGHEYEIDLSEKNTQRLRDALEEFIKKARPVERPPVLTLAPTRPTRRQSSGGSGTREDIGQIRAWAESKGLDVAPRGRIKKEIVEAYDAEHS